jgi:hypothetical protein
MSELPVGFSSQVLAECGISRVRVEAQEHVRHGLGQLPVLRHGEKQRAFSALLLQGEDGFGDDAHAVGVDAGSAEDLPRLQLCQASFDRCPGRGKGPDLGPFGEGEFTAWRAPLGGGDQSPAPM